MPAGSCRFGRKGKGEAMANANDLTALAVQLGMRYYEEQNLLFGKLDGYECADRKSVV